MDILGYRLAFRHLASVSSPLPSPQTPTLVFLHEGLGCMAFWRGFPERLCEMTGLAGILFDRRGYGLSDPLKSPRTFGYLNREAHEFLPAVLDALGIERPVLIGHSDGGSIALLFSARFPERPAALVSEAAHVFVDAVTTAGIRAAVDAYRRGSLRKTLETFHGEKTDAVFRAWSDTWLHPAFGSWNVEKAIAGVRCPVLVIQGENDQYGTPAQMQAIARGVGGPSRALMLAGCGHAPHNDAPEAVADAVVTFFSVHGIGGNAAGNRAGVDGTDRF